jgi:D-alanine-D-alanine ligase
MRVAVLAGGRSPERDVSLRSGHRVASALAERRHETWLVDPAETPLVEALGERPPDICYLALHGKEGEDGTVQRLLDLLGLRYTGTAAFECEIAFDKLLAKDALARAGVSTPPWVAIEAWALRDLGAGSALGKAAERVGLPCVTKPSRSGSALGVGFVDRHDDLPGAVMAALSYSGAAIVESRVTGTEVTAGVVGSPLERLPLVEIVPKNGVYDYAGLRDVTRIDMIVDADERPWVLEVNVSPGMTETSLLPMAAQAAGWDLPELCDRVLRSALQHNGSL